MKGFCSSRITFLLAGTSLIFALVVLGTARPQTTSTPAKPVKPVLDNRDLLVMQAAVGFIAAPGFSESPYDIDPFGKIHVLPGTGSITYNFRTGDSAVHIAGDHVEPAVTIENPQDSDSNGLNTLACIGNKVRVIDGEAKGAEGFVIGKHGGAEHVMVDFPEPKILEKMVIGDKMQVQTIGVGLELKNVKDVKAMNISPYLLDCLTKAGMGVTDDGKLRLQVTHRIPARIMGSGLGSEHVYRGDYDIQLFDEKTVKEFGLEDLRFGDIVAVIDADNSYGRIYREGAISIGVVSHSRSNVAGHGPGMTTLFSSPTGNFELFLTPGANLAVLLGLRRNI